MPDTPRTLDWEALTRARKALVEYLTELYKPEPGWHVYLTWCGPKDAEDTTVTDEGLSIYGPFYLAEIVESSDDKKTGADDLRVTAIWEGADVITLFALCEEFVRTEYGRGKGDYLDGFGDILYVPVPIEVGVPDPSERDERIAQIKTLIRETTSRRGTTV